MKNALYIKNNHHAIKWLVVTGFFLTYFFIGIALYKDYGISWDEPNNRLTGLVSLKHVLTMIDPRYVKENKVFDTTPTLSDYPNRDYGVFFQVPLVALELWLGLNNSQDIYFTRHLATFIISFLGAIAVFKIGHFRFKDWRLALLGSFFMVLSPRFFAESFYNGKDIVFMSFFAISMYTAIRFTSHPSFSLALLHAAATAIAIDVRIMGLIIALITPMLLLFLVFQRRLTISRALYLSAIYFLFTMFFTVLAWPYLWSSPFDNFMLAFNNMAHFRWDNNVFYMGENIRSTELPWHYPFIWMGITIPVPFLLLFAAGIYAILRKLSYGIMTASSSDNEILQDGFFLAMFFLPVLSVVALKSVLYDGWRQLYFIYPAFILISLVGWSFVFNCFQSRFGRTGASVIFTLTAATLLYLIAWTIKSHPLQNVYFNIFAPDEVRSRFEVDYWGLSNRMALEWIANNDPSKNITVGASSFTPLQNSVLILAPETRNRLEIKKSTVSDYVLTNYRHDFPSAIAENMRYEPLHDIRVDGEPVISIYKKKIVELKNVDADPYTVRSNGGISGQMFSGTNFETHVTNLVSTLDGAPFNGKIGRLVKTHYSIRWQGFVYFNNPGEQILCTVSDDGVRLYLDAQIIIDDWSIHPPTTNCEKLNIEQGWYPLRLEYFQEDGREVIRLLHGKSQNDAIQLDSKKLCCKEN